MIKSPLVPAVASARAGADGKRISGGLPAVEPKDAVVAVGGAE